VVGTLEQAYRDQWGYVLAACVRFLGDFDLAEEATQDAFTIAAERWARDGMPTNPRAWLVTTARNRAVDRFRRLQIVKSTDGFKTARDGRHLVSRCRRDWSLCAGIASAVVENRDRR
jgi:RNA polymerase sigma-70 factor (ECF subfamily)